VPSDAVATEATLKATATELRLETARVREFLLSSYGLEASLRRLPGENRNYLVEAEGDSPGRWVLKIGTQGQSVADFELEDSVIEHLARTRFEPTLPRTVAALDGSAVPRLEVADGTILPARLCEHVAGTPWTELGSPSSELLRRLGRMLGELGVALEDFDHPLANRTHSWELPRVAEHRDALPFVEDPARRRLLDDALHLYRAGAEPRLAELSTSFIHCDVNDENLLVEGEEIRGLLDFGDAQVNPTVCELAIAVAYAGLRRDDPLAAGGRIVAGYEEIRPLSDAERDVLFPLVCGRLITSLAVATKRRHAGATDPNFFATEAVAWDLLERLLAVEPAAAAAALVGTATRAAPGHSSESLLARRRRYVGPALSLAYDEPLEIVRGAGQYLYDRRGRPFLDLVNNVCHVGHCHPRVVDAGRRQMSVLNTNTRYLYPGLTDYAERLATTLPGPLEVCFMVNSGSEANELALRLARARTGRRGMLVVEGAYHGHTSTLIDISPYKFLGRGGSGVAEPWVRMVPMPDGYRGEHKGQGAAAGHAYGDAVGAVLARSEEPVAGLILESLLGCGGQIIPPERYLETAFGHVRAAGGVCIADEVQVGFGRVGSRFWAFETQSVVPDVVVLGKPIGNGHPMAAVVTTAEIAGSFANGMEFFSTFGGNPVSCAIGLAVLDVIEEEELQAHALDLGRRFLDGLRHLEERHELVGDVRGLGLFLGIELVTDRRTLAPAADAASLLIDRLKERGILISTDGPLHNVLKIKPPMVLTRADVDRTLYVLDSELERLS
jgi:4-aminobutyrate aminotransferase-like enzyme